jgi:hypothetical protein
MSFQLLRVSLSPNLILRYNNNNFLLLRGISFFLRIQLIGALQKLKCYFPPEVDRP